jgi:hypothetical protein
VTNVHLQAVLIPDLKHRHGKNQPSVPNFPGPPHLFMCDRALNANERTSRELQKPHNLSY